MLLSRTGESLAGRPSCVSRRPRTFDGTASPSAVDGVVASPGWSGLPVAWQPRNLAKFRSSKLRPTHGRAKTLASHLQAAATLGMCFSLHSPRWAAPPTCWSFRDHCCADASKLSMPNQWAAAAIFLLFSQPRLSASRQRGCCPVFSPFVAVNSPVSGSHACESDRRNGRRGCKRTGRYCNQGKIQVVGAFGRKSRFRRTQGDGPHWTHRNTRTDRHAPAPALPVGRRYPMYPLHAFSFFRACIWGAE